jgi:hypothetical protein
MVKYLEEDTNRFKPKPANRRYQNIGLAEPLGIVGVVTGLFREYGTGEHN